MSDLAAVGGEAEAALGGPRFSVAVGSAFGFLGSALVGAIVGVLASLAELGEVTLVLLALAGMAYAIGLLVWAGMWRRPLAVAAVLGASLVGLPCGFLLGLVLLWLAVPDARPNLVLA